MCVRCSGTRFRMAKMFTSGIQTPAMTAFEQKGGLFKSVAKSLFQKQNTSTTSIAQRNELCKQFGLPHSCVALHRAEEKEMRIVG